MPCKPESTHRGSPEVEANGLVDQGVELLLKELERGISERLEQYLAFTARFHRYSVSNQMLIYMQCPKATHVAGYRTWQEMGYQVARGEKGIRILAPRPHERINEKTGETEKRISFATVSVFDASQLADLDEHPLPAFFTPLADDQQELYTRLVQVVQEDSISVSEDWTGTAQGYSARKRIALREGMDSRNRILTLIHEYAHELLHWTAQGQEQTQQVKECHAEAIAYVVAHHFGIHNPFSADYLQSWGTTPKELRAELEIVRRTAAYIIDKVEKPAGQSEFQDETP